MLLLNSYKKELTYNTFSLNIRTWAIMNLPMGNYSLLFRASTYDQGRGGFAIDNIAIVSCNYPAVEFYSYEDFLSFSCDFDNSTMCGMTNGNSFSSIMANFSRFTADTIPYPELGPTRDHTTNSTSGGFLYWNRTLPFTVSDYGVVGTEKRMLQNLGMCIKFAYYVKSSIVNKNATQIIVSIAGCYAETFWLQPLDDSQGWQTAIEHLGDVACEGIVYFNVQQSLPIPVSIAFDDIQIDQCNRLNPTTTTTLTSSTTTQLSTTEMSSSEISTTTVSTIRSTTEKTSRLSTTISTTTIRNDSNRKKIFLNGYILAIVCAFFQKM